MVVICDVQAIHKEAAGDVANLESIPVTDGTIMRLQQGQSGAFFFVETKSSDDAGQKPKTLALLTREKVSHHCSTYHLESYKLLQSSDQCSCCR